MNGREAVQPPPTINQTISWSRRSSREIPRERRYLGRAVAAGTASAATTYALFSVGLIPGSLQLIVAAILIGTLPTAPSLSRRVALNGSLAIGWVPLLWWVDWPVDVDHGALVVALVLGVQVGIPAAHQHPLSDARRCLPVVTRVDSLLLLPAIAALVATQDWFFARSPRRALEVLLPGIDNMAHFHMFATSRAQHVSVTAAGPPGDGSQWAFDEYPQGFHSLVGTISELMYPHLPPGPQTLLAYVHGVAVLVVLGMTVVSATILALPRLDRRFGVALPVITVVCAAYLWEPGQKILANGFGNFWLAAVAASCALLMSLSAPRSRDAINVTTVSGLLISVAHTWTPLLAIAGAAVLIVLFGGDSVVSAVQRRRRLRVCVCIFAVASLAIGKALAMLLSSVQIGFLVTAFGGIYGSSQVPTFLLVVVTLYVGFAYEALIRRRQGTDEELSLARRVRLLWFGPLAGVALAAALLVAQMHALGTTSYYLFKYLMGLELILAAVASALCGMLLSTVSRRVARRSIGVTLSIGATLIATQAFGSFPSKDPLMLSETDGGTAGIRVPYSRQAIADGVISAAGASSPSRSLRQEYLPLGVDRAAQAYYPDAWFHAIEVSLTDDVGARINALRVPMKGVNDALPSLRRLLAEDHEVEVLVDPQYVVSLRHGLGKPDLSRRVVSWTVGGAG